MYLRRTVAVACVGALALLGQELAAVASPSPSLVLRYTFEQDTTVAVHDSSASGLTGVLVNADPATAFIDGVPGRKRVLQLVASKRQYVDVPQSDTIDVDQYTLAAWIRYTGVSTPDTHDRWEVMEKAGAYWMNVRTNGRLRAGGFYGGCEASQYWTFLDSNQTITPNVWTHVAATYNGAKLALYINGERSGSIPVTGTTCSNDEPLAVGAKNAPAKGILEAFWDGRLDDVRVYNKALTARRVASLAG